METIVSPGSPAALLLDAKTGAAVNIPVEHKELHDGDFFCTHHQATGKNDGDTISIVFKTPNTTKRIHVFAKAFASGQAYFYIKEGSTFTDNTGSAHTVFNRERNSATVTTVIDAVANPAVAAQVRTDPTGMAGGTEIYRELMGGTSPKTTGEVRYENEWVLDQNTLYAFIVESDAAGEALNLVLNWYEL